MSFSFQDSSNKSECSSSHSNKSSRSSIKGNIIAVNTKKLNKSRSQPIFTSSSTSSSTSPSPNTTITDRQQQPSHQIISHNKSNSVKSVSNNSIKEADEGVFEIAIRGKGIKRGKVAVVSDISADHCLELPYSPKTLKPPSNPIDNAIKRSKRKTVRVKSEGSSSPATTQTVNTPKIIKTDTNKAVYSTNYIGNKNLSTSSVASQKPKAEIPALSSRDSYSSKVLGHEKQKAKVTPVGKIIPEMKRVAPQMPLGAIGQKIAPSLPLFNHSSPLSLFSHDVPNHNPLQTYYMNQTPPLSMHSWDPKTVTPSVIPPPGPPPGLASPNEQWTYKQLQGANTTNNVWSNEQPPAPTPLPSSPSSWNNLSSIWSSSTSWNSNQSPWAPQTAVSQGLGFNPFRSAGWPAESEPENNAGGWPQQPQYLPTQNSSPRKNKLL